MRNYLVTQEHCTTCGPVKELLEQLAPKYGVDYDVVDANTEEGQKLVTDWRVMSTPTFISHDPIHGGSAVVTPLRVDRGQITKLLTGIRDALLTDA